MKKLSMLIRNGHVMDPRGNVNGIQDIGIVGNRIVAVPEQPVEAEYVVDASGCYVLPGLIDFHTHCYYRQPDARTPDWMLAYGITAASDFGTCGYRHYGQYHDMMQNICKIRMKSILNMSADGLIGFYERRIEPDYSFSSFDPEDYLNVIRKYREDIFGVKLIMGRHLMSDDTPLKKTLEFAGQVEGLRVCVHTKDPPCQGGKIASLLRPGDVYVHCYHGTGLNIFDACGKVDVRVREAKERGVLFDTSSGKSNFSFSCAQAAMEQGFFPDIISTDYVSRYEISNDFSQNLLICMEKFMALGMNLFDIVRAVTETPARVMGIDGQIGTLAENALADICIVEPRKKEVVFRNGDHTEQLSGHDILIPRMTLLDGKIAHCANDFDFFT